MRDPSLEWLAGEAWLKKREARATCTTMQNKRCTSLGASHEDIFMKSTEQMMASQVPGTRYSSNLSSCLLSVSRLDFPLDYISD